MARFTTFAEILTPDLLPWKAYQAGIVKNPPGQLLKDILDYTKGVYALKLDLREDVKDQMRKIANVSSDPELLRITRLAQVTVSLEHLRDLDPETTRIVCGYRFDVNPNESELAGLKDKGPYDPRNTMRFDER
jgi:hypothetical protein